MSSQLSGVAAIAHYLRRWEKANAIERSALSFIIVGKLHEGIASGTIRMYDIDDPLMKEYLDSGWEDTITFTEYVASEREKEAAIREKAACN